MYLVSSILEDHYAGDPLTRNNITHGSFVVVGVSPIKITLS
jgi:hypothetical protein